MMILKKMILLICLGFGAFVPGVYANETTEKVDKQINIMVGQVFNVKDKNHRLNAQSLKVALTTLKNNVLKVIENHKKDYQDLHESLEKLNLESNNLPEVLSQLKTVVKNLPAKSQAFLKAKFPLLG
jgi:uncharacterized protein YhaN